MRQRLGNQRVDELLQQEVLPSEEQHEVLAALQQARTQQAWLWHLVCTALGLVFATVLLGCAWRQTSDPWSMRHHSYLQGTSSARSIALAEAGSAAILIASAAMLGHDLYHHPQRRAASRAPASSTARLMPAGIIGIAVILAVYWLQAIWHASRWQDDTLVGAVQYLWLAVIPLGYSALALYVIQSLRSIDQELLKMENSMYDHKTA